MAERIHLVAGDLHDNGLKSRSGAPCSGDVACKRECDRATVNGDINLRAFTGGGLLADLIEHLGETLVAL